LPFVERQTLLWKEYDLASEKMRALVTFLAASKAVLDPTLVSDQSAFVIPWADQMNSADNDELPPALAEKWRTDPVPEFLKLSPDMKQSAAAGFEKRKRFVGMCHRAGVRIIAGTDGPGLGTMLPGLGLQHELHLLVDSGFTPLEAIRAATVEAAATLGREADLGVIQPGAFADLVIVSADPIVNIDNAGKI